MRLSHSGEAYFVDPVASTETPAIDTDVFSDPVGANGYSSGEDQARYVVQGARFLCQMLLKCIWHSTRHNALSLSHTCIMTMHGSRHLKT
jgi:hypothetical protein